VIVGIGTDIFDVSRMRSKLEGDGGRLREVIFTPREVEYCEEKRYPARHYAARFAAKEALLKALAYDGRGGLVWRQIEIDRDRSGQPRVLLHGKLRERAESLFVNRILVSLSHSNTTAVAQVILES
jgi:holo-[acyl-carrier protein] synthase